MEVLSSWEGIGLALGSIVLSVGVVSSLMWICRPSTWWFLNERYKK